VSNVSSRISRCQDLAGVYSCISITCRSRAAARVYGEGIHIVGLTVARDSEATST
jgi:hypothetical protein